MLDNHDTLMELRRQLEQVRRRIDETVALLSESRDGVTADGLEGVATATWVDTKGDLFQLCVRLEVALAESRESVEKLTRRLKELAEGDQQGWPWVADDPAATRSGDRQDWQH
jgi:hypothetical protein